MIWDSGPWREMLLEHSEEYLNKFILKDNEEDDFQFFNFEKNIFLDAYIIRKLIDAKKILTKDESLMVKLNNLHRNNSKITRNNWHNLEKHYNLETNNIIEKYILDICHLIIHSYIFIPTINKQNKFNGFYFSSDKTKEKSLYQITIDEWTHTIAQIAESWPNEHRWHIDSEGKEIIENK